jgi:putative peptidoglycan lipid II flippase
LVRTPTTLVSDRRQPGRNSLVIAASSLATALFGALQALLIVLIAGKGASTDGFFVAYALYLPIALVGASLRVSVVPFLGSPGSELSFREHVSEIAGRIFLLGIVLAVALFASARLVGPGLAHGLPPDGRQTTFLVLLILAPAAYFQIHAATISAVLVAARRFGLSAFLYALTSAVAVGISAVLLKFIGVLGAAVGLLVGAALLALLHSAYAYSLCLRIGLHARWFVEREQWLLATRILAGSALIIAPQANLAVSLSAVSDRPGAVTAYSYAFFFVSMMLGLSAAPLAVGTLPDLIRRAAQSGNEAAREKFIRLAPFNYAVLAPMVAAFVSFGEPILRAIFSHSLTNSTVQLMYERTATLCVMAIPAALYVLGIVGVLALERWGVAVAIATGGLAIQVAAVTASYAFGPVAVAIAHTAASTITTLLLLVVIFRGMWRRTLGRALWSASPAFALSLIFPTLRAALGRRLGVEEALAAIAIAALIYAALALVLWPSVSRYFVELIGRRPTSRGTHPPIGRS